MRYILNGSLLNGIGAKAALTDELLWWLVVDRRKSGKLSEETVEKSRR